MKLITEISEDVEYLKEDTDNGKSYYINGVFLQGNITNRNGRIYPMPVLESAVNRYQKEHIEQKRSFGELGHPPQPSINLDRVSHMIVKLQREGNNFLGKAKIMDTPMGKIVKNLIDEGARLGVSSRGLGALKKTTRGNEVQEGLYFSTAADIVADPSAPQAFVNAVMEDREWVLENGMWVEAHQPAMKKMNSKAREAAALKLFESYLRSLM